MYEGGGKKSTYAWTHHIYRGGGSKTRTSAEVYSPLVANSKGLGRLTGRTQYEVIYAEFPKPRLELLTGHKPKLCTFSEYFDIGYKLCSGVTKSPVLPHIKQVTLMIVHVNRNWSGRTHLGHRISVSERKTHILSFEHCAHYNGPEDLCAVESYAPVKLNKGKVFPQEGQMRISGNADTWARVEDEDGAATFWPSDLTGILWL